MPDYIQHNWQTNQPRQTANPGISQLTPLTEILYYIGDIRAQSDGQSHLRIPVDPTLVANRNQIASPVRLKLLLFAQLHVHVPQQPIYPCLYPYLYPYPTCPVDTYIHTYTYIQTLTHTQTHSFTLTQTNPIPIPTPEETIRSLLVK
ncbi:hypothetical protein BO99DRAFT_260514 [Aspergillus violaceofuscus CBS 115571]|uniref:Uncharacterized protein n=1 Tax=Aspergillus violaceofuscus (strain CBS 115571) TaxID=1450538 RepID=A0A2V5GVK1_ASPV1|nr:hypothetical protein BO99DRAFT_260514 [Aspergillus violaceofuscus CBS 115571]